VTHHATAKGRLVVDRADFQPTFTHLQSPQKVHYHLFIYCLDFISLLFYFILFYFILFYFILF